MAALDFDNLWLMLTEDGVIVVDLLPEVAPLAVERIKTLTQAGFYDGLTFHRVIEGFVAQGGDPNGNGTGGSDLPDLPLEPSDIPHVRGAVSFARAQDLNSANSQFFIVLDDARFLDTQYTLFGQVIQGMDVVDLIERGDPNANGAVANPEVILDAEIAGDLTPITGTDGRDVESLEAFDFRVDLGDGTDTATLQGPRAAFTIGVSAAASTVPTVTLYGGEVLTELNNVERIVFSDGTLVVDTSDPIYTVYGLYQAALDREPDPAGLRYFADLANQGARLGDIARDLAGSPEFLERFGELDDLAFVEQMYLNVLGRPGEQGGIDFFTGVLADGATRGEVLRDFVRSEENVVIIQGQVGDGVFIPDFSPIA